MSRNNLVVLGLVVLCIVIITVLGISLVNKGEQNKVTPVAVVATETGKNSGAATSLPNVLTGTQFPTAIPTPTEIPFQQLTLENYTFPGGLPSVDFLWNIRDRLSGNMDIYYGNFSTGAKKISGAGRSKFAGVLGTVSGSVYFLTQGQDSVYELDKVAGGAIQKVTALAFTPEEIWLSPTETNLLVTENKSGQTNTNVYLVSLSTGEATGLSLGDGVKELVGWLDDQTLIVKNTHSSQVYLLTFSIPKNAVLNAQTNDGMEKYNSIALSPNKQFVLLGDSRMISLLQLSTGEIKPILTSKGEVFSASSWSNDGAAVIVSLYAQNRVYYYNLTDGTTQEKTYSFIDPLNYYNYFLPESNQVLVAEDRFNQKVFFVSNDNLIGQLDLTSVQIGNIYSSFYF